MGALKKLSRDNLANLTPHPLHVFLTYSHPPVLARIAAATAQLAPIADGRERDARLQAEARIGRLSKPGCYRGEAYSETLAFPLKTS